MKVFVVLFAVILAASSEPNSLEALIDEINSSQDLWTAAPNPISAKGVLEAKKLLGAKRSEDRSGYPVRTFADYDIDENNIPKKFDARQQWSDCSTIWSIKDQSDCGSCWAVAAASAMSDRLCIASEYKISLNLSAQNLVSCCTACGYGCEGGYPEKAWDYFRDIGLPTGGDYGSKEGCQPYEIEPCGSDPGLPPCPAVPPATPSCHLRKCTNKKYKKKFNKDKHYATTSYFVDSNAKAMQAELLKNGPMEAAFDVYEDFMTYKSGVYKHTTGGYLGGHAVRVLGWGTEKGKNYWLVANSWNANWGDNGYFKFIRGSNDCGFESYVNAGLVKPK